MRFILACAILLVFIPSAQAELASTRLCKAEGIVLNAQAGKGVKYNNFVCKKFKKYGPYQTFIVWYTIHTKGSKDTHWAQLQFIGGEVLKITQLDNLSGTNI